MEETALDGEEQKALEAAPRTVDPIQQTIVTVLQNALNHPSIQRSRAIRAIRFPSQPMLSVQVRALREAYRAFQGNGDVVALLEGAVEMETRFGSQTPAPEPAPTGGTPKLKRDDLNLICSDFISGWGEKINGARSRQLLVNPTGGILGVLQRSRMGKYG